MTKIFAHRGASAYAPENTMEAFELAAKQGADGIELDVHVTKHGVLCGSRYSDASRGSRICQYNKYGCKYRVKDWNLLVSAD